MGSPQNLKDTVYPFEYNRFDQLEDIVSRHDIGVIKMEVQRSVAPQDGFLAKVRSLASEKGIVLVFDECTSGLGKVLAEYINFTGLSQTWLFSVKQSVTVTQSLLSLDGVSLWRQPNLRLSAVHLDRENWTIRRA